MNINAASKLDIEKFRKVHVLITGGATEGERQAAKASADKMARRAGITFEQAVSNLDTPKPSPQPKNIFDDLFNSPEMKAQKAEREARYAVRRAEVLKERGTIKAVLDPTSHESLLLKAGEPFVTEWRSYEDACGTIRQGAKRFAGITGSYFNLKDVGTEAVEAIKLAFPFPESILDAFEELRAWDKLSDDRAHFYSHHEYYYDKRVELRIDLLREVMRNQPVISWDDLEARLHYKSYEWQRQWIDERSFDDPEWARLFADVKILRSQCNDIPVQTGHTTASTRRNAALSLLCSHSELSDREIARRTGVSPQTVGNLRRKRKAVP